ncbi:type II toxin-antitoxin system RelB/DinJ family antitoxin [Candidatus Saccharibacteria bacterium]|nr:type II toxin-antitoxin system RelB/DinJ family antitoxin [Candidatus Saccharibacteria bacterium]
MSNAVINIRTDKELKEKAQAVADEMGLSLSALLNNQLREVIRTRQASFRAKPERMTPKMESIIAEAIAEYNRGEYLGPFDTADEAIKALKK